MAQINLLLPGYGSGKTEARKVTFKDPKAEFLNISKPLIVYSCISLGLVLVVGIFLSFNLSSKTKILNNLKEQEKALKINPKEIEKIKNERAFLERKVHLIDALSSRDFYYYEKLQLIADLIPDGVWLTEIYSRKEGSASAGRSADKKSLGLEKNVFTIKGIAVSEKLDDAVTLIEKYIELLRSNQEFSKDFGEIKLNNSNLGSVGKQDVMNFDIICEVKAR
ncbi:MAG: hypothetical protein ABIJ41_04660 [Candidatus Omnitrophota bacterium]